MQSKSLILLILALGCGVVASIGITQVMANRSAGPAVPKLETAPVFVIKEDIPLGNQLTAEVLKLEQWPKDKVPEGALGKLEDVEGRRPRTKLFAGEPVLDVKLLSKGESAGGAAPQIPVGYRSVPVRVDEVSGGAAMILPGDRVDVLVYAKQGNGISQTLTKTILQDVKVFAVDAQWTLESDEGGKAIRAKTISMLLTPEQTERVMLAHELGKIRLALRSPNDHEEAELPDGGHRIGQVFGDSQMADHERDSTLMAQATPQLPLPMTDMMEQPGQPSHTVRVISGAKVNQVKMLGAPEDTTSQDEAGDVNDSATSFLWKIISRPLPGADDKMQTVSKEESAKDAEPDADPDTDPSLKLDPDFVPIDPDA
jgi:pilus assembly protein CpaB